MINKNSKIFIAGHNGMVGSAILRCLKVKGFKKLYFRERCDLDLFDNFAVKKYIEKNKFDLVICCAAYVGGIHANSKFQGDFIMNNLAIQNNLIINSFQSGVRKLIFLGSSCIYPKNLLKPIQENLMLKSSLEDTNEPYAVAKIAGLKLCEYLSIQYGCDYRTIIPCNLYGPNDNFHPKNSHVLAALIRKFHYSKIKNKSSVQVWGTGKPKREFLHVDDLANGIFEVMRLSKEKYRKILGKNLNHINIGSGNDVSIKELSKIIKRVTSSQSKIIFDQTKPDGVKRKLLDISKMNKIGWKPNNTLEEGIKKFYAWYIEEGYQ